MSERVYCVQFFSLLVLGKGETQSLQSELSHLYAAHACDSFVQRFSCNHIAHIRTQRSLATGIWSFSQSSNHFAPGWKLFLSPRQCMASPIACGTEFEFVNIEFGDLVPIKISAIAIIWRVTNDSWTGTIAEFSALFFDTNQTSLLSAISCDSFAMLYNTFACVVKHSRTSAAPDMLM